jgi:hypothetical protein
MDVYSRQFLQGRDVGKAGSGYVVDFRTAIEDDMRNGRYINLLKVRIFEELGWDSRPLLKYREQWQARKDADEVRKRNENAQAAEQAPERAPTGNGSGSKRSGLTSLQGGTSAHPTLLRCASWPA